MSSENLPINKYSLASTAREPRPRSSSVKVEEFTNSHHFDDFLAGIAHLLHMTPNFETLSKTFNLVQPNIKVGISISEYCKTILCRLNSAMHTLKWKAEHKYILVWVAHMYCLKNGIEQYRMDENDWRQISKAMNIDKDYLKTKWTSIHKHTTYKFKWHPQEDEVLKRFIKFPEYKEKWTQLALKIHEHSGQKVLRTCKDVRERWFNYLNPEIKRTEWTEEQDQNLLHLVKKIGKKWSAISRIIKNRTENMVKNRFRYLVKFRGLDEAEYEAPTYDRGEEDSNKFHLTQHPTTTSSFCHSNGTNQNHYAFKQSASELSSKDNNPQMLIPKQHEGLFCISDLGNGQNSMDDNQSIFSLMLGN